MDREAPKILVVTGPRPGKGLMEYALKVAGLLDLEITVLFIDDSSPCTSDEERQQLLAVFEAQVEGEAAEFSARAWEMAIDVTTIVDVSERQQAVNQVLEQEPEIRFILTDPAYGGEPIDDNDEYPRLTVLRSPGNG